MDRLIILSTTIKQVYGNLLQDQDRIQIIHHFQSLLKRPLVRFDEAYSTFIKSVGSNTDTFDRWLNIQFQVITLLAEDQEALKQLPKMFQEVLATTEGGEALDAKDPDDYKRYSFLIALAFRIYLDDMPIANRNPTPDDKQ